MLAMTTRGSDRIKLLSTAFAVVMTVGVSFGQTQPGVPKDIIPPSPDAQSLQKYGNIPVSLYSGLPQISVPIYEIKTRDLSVPISLSYHASGIKVSEEASRVGLGWALNAGGVITRTIVNRDDFQSVYGYLDASRNAGAALNTTRIFPKDSSLSIYIRDNVQWGTIARLINPGHEAETAYDRLFDAVDISTNQDYDFEPDQFSFNFNGNSGQFFVRQNTDNTLEAVLQKKEKLYITLTRNVTTTPVTVSWTIKTGDGTTYVFDKPEGYRRNGFNEVKNISSWYLTSITSPKGDKVTFDYDVIGDVFVKPIGQFRQIVQATDQDDCDYMVCSGIYPDPSPTDVPGQTYSTVRLKTITWANGKVDFEMGPRDDVEADVRVDKVKVSSLDPVTNTYTLREIYDFGYDYFTEVATSPTYPANHPVSNNTYATMRLRLNSVTRQYPNPGVPLRDYAYKFEYFPGGLPAKTSFSRDHWGYYNASGASSLIPSFTPQSTASTPTKRAELAAMGEERNARATPRTEGTLQKIYYPTGGSTEFTFESNTYDIGASQGTGPQNPTAPFGDSKTAMAQRNGNGAQSITYDIDLSDEYAVYASGPTSDPESYSVSMADIKVTFTSNTPLQNCTTSSGANYKVTINKLIGPGLDQLGPEIKRTSASADNQSCLPNGIDCTTCDSYHVVVHVQALLKATKFRVTFDFPNDNGQFSRVDVKADYLVDPQKRGQTVDPNDQFAYAGGLRVAQIVDYDPESDDNYNTRTYLYHKRVGNDNRSNGILLITPRYSYYDVGYSRNQNGDYCLACGYIVRQSDSILPTTGSAGVVVGYSEVTEVHGVGSVTQRTGANGSISYSFHNEPETVIAYRHPLNYNYLMKPPAVGTRPNPLNGSPKSTVYYNYAGTPLKTITYDYDYMHARYDYGMEIRRISMPGIGNEQVPTDPSSLATDGRPLRSYFNLYLYPVMSSFVYNKSITETADGVTKTTTFSYDNPKHLQVSTTVVSTGDGHDIETRTKYPADYTAVSTTSPIGKMNTLERYMVTVPVEMKITDVTAGVILKNTLGVFNFFDADHALNLPNDKFIMAGEVADLKAPVLSSETGFTGYNPANSYSSTYYRSTATVDYNTQGNVKLIQKNFDMPVSYLWGVRNSFPVAEITNAAADAVLIESFEGMVSSSVAGVTPHTGVSYRATPYVTGFVIPENKTYIVEYWYYSGGWLHKKVEVTAPAGNATPVSISTTDGSAIDDLRIYPKAALVRSFTYGPLGEQTSSISESGVVRINDFDTFGRLVRVRNEKGEIEKQFTYHYKKY
jgi:hypothetical protein